MEGVCGHHLTYRGIVCAQPGVQQHVVSHPERGVHSNAEGAGSGNDPAGNMVAGFAVTRRSSVRQNRSCSDGGGDIVVWRIEV